MRHLSLTILLALPAALTAQNPLAHPTDGIEVHYSADQPVVNYVIHVDSTDLSGYGVEIRLGNLPDTFRLAMVKHPEYDDRYWRYVEDLRVETAAGPGTITRLDSALWRVRAPGGSAIVRYRMHLPPPQPLRAAWRPFLARDGGLVGGVQSFLYLAGQTLAPAHVTLDLPAGWNAATGLEPTSDPRTFFAPTVDVLVDSPILIGSFHDWHFFVDGVPHRIVYWSLLPSLPFDTLAFTRGIEGVVRQAITLFGRAPYREYTFLVQDDAYGALEHLNSVTVGAPSGELAKDPNSSLGEFAHEYFHAWNGMRIRPVEFGGADYRPQPLSGGLWVSEGWTMYYADLLRRRAGNALEDSTRTAHVARLIAAYLREGGYSEFSAERISRAEYSGDPGALGDWQLSTHLQGELLATMLDLVIRDATRDGKSLDDVMRTLNERYSGATGFTTKDVEGVVGEVCGCQVTRFFDTYVRHAHAIAFDDYLRLAGLHASVTWGPAEGDSGAAASDLRIYATTPDGGHNPTLVLGTPNSVWGKAGLHTGDRILRLDGVAIRSVSDFRTALRRLRIGQTSQLAVEREGKTLGVTLVMRGYDVPTVAIEENRNATARQRALREAWLAGGGGSDDD